MFNRAIVKFGLWTASVFAALVINISWSNSREFAFEYMETDVFFQSRVRLSIQKEYMDAVVVLKAKADRFGIDVRMVDIEKLKLHLSEKAFLLARCLDVAIRQASDRNGKKLEPFATECVRLHLEFIDKVERDSIVLPSPYQMSDSLRKSQIEYCSIRSQIFNAPRFDFLMLGDKSTYSPMLRDYIRFRACIFDRQ
jgi:hypothetical protein